MPRLLRHVGGVARGLVTRHQEGVVRQMRERPGGQQPAGSRLRVVGEQRLLEPLPQRAARRRPVQELRPVLAALHLLSETPQPRLGRAMARVRRPFCVDLLRGRELTRELRMQHKLAGTRHAPATDRRGKFFRLRRRARPASTSST